MLNVLGRVLRSPQTKIMAGTPLEVGGRSVIDRIAPSGLFVELDYFHFSSTQYGRIWFVEDWPESMGMAYLRELYDFPANIRFSLFVRPLDPGLVVHSVKRELTQLRAQRLAGEQEGKIPDFGVIATERSTEEILQRLQEEQSPILMVSLYVCLFASSLAELNKLSRRLEDLLLDAGLRAHRAMARQEAAIIGMLPLGVNLLNQVRNMDSHALGSMFPFLSSDHLAPRGHFLGINRANGTLLTLDIFDEQNTNLIAVGNMGSGKSLFLKYQVDQAILTGTRCIVIDLEGEFKPLSEDLGGAYLDMSTAAENRMNILDINPEDRDPLTEGYYDFLGWLDVALRERRGTPALSAREKNLVDVSYKEVMRLAGIEQHDPESWRRPAPILSDWYRALKQMHQPDAEQLAERVARYAVGLLSEAFDCRTNVSVDNPLVVFDLKDVPDELKPIRVRQVQSFIWSNVLRKMRPTLVIVDEAWWLLQDLETARDLSAMARRFRKRFAGLWLSTQHAEDFARNTDAEFIRDTAAVTLLFAQNSSAIPLLQERFALSGAEARDLVVLHAGEALLITRHHRIPIYVAVPRDRYPLYTTKPQELIALQREDLPSSRPGRSS